MSFRVPPASTGLYVVPKLLAVTVAPVVMFEGVVAIVVVVVAVVVAVDVVVGVSLLPPPLLPLVHRLQALMSKFQMPDVGDVCVKAKV